MKKRLVLLFAMLASITSCSSVVQNDTAKFDVEIQKVEDDDTGGGGDSPKPPTKPVGGGN